MGTYDTAGGTPVSPDEIDPCSGCPYEDECIDPVKCLWEEHNREADNAERRVWSNSEGQ